MKHSLAILCVGLMLVGCSGKEPDSVQTASKQPLAPTGTVAIVNGQPISTQQLVDPLKEAYGLNMLLNIVQLEAAKQRAEKNHTVVTEEDVSKEMDRYLGELFRQNNEKGLLAIDEAEAKGQKDVADRIRRDIIADNRQLIDQFLRDKHISRPEFDIAMRTEAYLRKIVEPTIQGAITDKMLQDGFRFQYGEKVLVRHIQCTNWQEIGIAKKMLAEGMSFEDVAKAVSRNPRTGPMGGELVPFSRQDPRFTDVFKEASFALKVGEISDAVSTEGAYHLIKLEKRIDPIAVKFDDVKEAIRKQLYDGLLAANTKLLRNELAQDAMKTLVIKDPILKAQYDKRVADAKPKVKGRDDYRDKAAGERRIAEAAITTQPTTAPATMPAPVPATAPAAK